MAQQNLAGHIAKYVICELHCRYGFPLASVHLPEISRREYPARTFATSLAGNSQMFMREGGDG